ncbi:hypothetical protein D8674_008876 [Pyrus ussuriensis x Pyrus communis]|uniref:Uncharacterized protein n=1 Tax=Pyrus ussuriensis x Pyrus communis TaxID=2448454 RepID=A0A5N5HWY1_9ROSA|nr:hypothetical protein D8674_008876 [Pyrus ussuriensis x Pyrus communis]
MRVKKPVLTQNLLELQQRDEEDHTDDQSDAASDADQDHDQIEGTQQKDQEAIADTEKEQIDGNVKPLFEIPDPIPPMSDLSDFYTNEEWGFEVLRVEVHRVKKGEENVTLAGDKEAISAHAIESRNDFHTQQEKGQRNENAIPGSDKDVISALESKSGNDFDTEEEKGCEVSVESLKGSRKEIKIKRDYEIDGPLPILLGLYKFGNNGTQERGPPTRRCKKGESTVNNSNSESMVSAAKYSGNVLPHIEGLLPENLDA